MPDHVEVDDPDGDLVFKDWSYLDEATELHRDGPHCWVLTVASDRGTPHPQYAQARLARADLERLRDALIAELG